MAKDKTDKTDKTAEPGKVDAVWRSAKAARHAGVPFTTSQNIKPGSAAPAAGKEE